MKNKLSVLMSALLLMAVTADGQILHPVHWSFACKRLPGKEAEIFLRAEIDKGWHIYSTKQEDGGPQKTAVSFRRQANYEMIGDLAEPVPVTHFEKAFNMNVSYFERSVIFKRRVKLLRYGSIIKGKIAFMACNDQKCLPPDEVEFHIPVK